MMRVVLDVLLETPPLPELVPAGVFDAFAWSPPSQLLWRTRPRGERAGLETPLTGTNPAGMVFLFVEECSFLPGELARLHVPQLLRADESERRALAPYAIDDATDLLFERRAPARDVLSLATASLAGLFWGLHDWAHFHHHGPFEERAWTELQCDAAALDWLRINREELALAEDDLVALTERARLLTRARFVEEDKPDELANQAWQRVEGFLRRRS